MWRLLTGDAWLPVLIFAALSVVAGASFYTGYDYGVSTTAFEYKQQLAERDRIAAAAMANALAEAHQQAQAALEAERLNLAVQEHTDQQFKIITNTVTKYVQTHPKANTCSLDVDGLRIWNSANHYTTSTTP